MQVGELLHLGCRPILAVVNSLTIDQKGHLLSIKEAACAFATSSFLSVLLREVIWIAGTKRNRDDFRIGICPLAPHRQVERIRAEELLCIDVGLDDFVLRLHIVLAELRVVLAGRHSDVEHFAVFGAARLPVLHGEVAVLEKVLRALALKPRVSAHSDCKGEVAPILSQDVCVREVALTDLGVDDGDVRCNKDLSHLMDAIAGHD